MIRALHDPRRLLIVGQVRGREATLDKVVGRAYTERADGIVALGNLFGAYPHHEDFLAHIDERCESLEVPLWFVDGPTDPHGFLASRSGPLSDWVTYLRRGETWSWGGIRFLAAGGGVTLQRAKVSSQWSPGEALAPSEVEQCAAVGRVDVVLAHGAPWGINVVGGVPEGQEDFTPDSRVREVEFRKGLRRICEQTRPRHWLCAPGGRVSSGPYQVGRRGERNVSEVRVDGLGDPDGDDGFELLDIRPPGPLSNAHPALVGDEPPESDVEHPALH